uniref:Uncharacterized protein n=1 Tax=Glossina brevipalpis TaxID=37001 RepID=A0A1A9X2M7_9MUSC
MMLSWLCRPIRNKRSKEIKLLSKKLNKEAITRKPHVFDSYPKDYIVYPRSTVLNFLWNTDVDKLTAQCSDVIYMTFSFLLVQVFFNISWFRFWARLLPATNYGNTFLCVVLRKIEYCDLWIYGYI